MGDKRLTKQEILDKFIIKADYGTPNAFPFGRGAVVVLSEISCESSDNDRWNMVGIHKNGDHLNHAETKLLQLLRDISSSVCKIDVKLTQNFSPCNLSKEENGAECAKDIVKYLTKMKKDGKKIEISITFANFYKTETYYGNDLAQAVKNRDGLRLLHDNGVKLNLLGGKDEWERLLKNELFVCLNPAERDACLEKAFSLARKERERRDRLLLKRYLEREESSLKALKLDETTSQDHQ